MDSRSRSRSPLGKKKDVQRVDAEGLVSVQVFTLAGERILQLPAASLSTTVRAVKDELCEASGGGPEELRLVATSGVLHDQQALAELAVQQSSGEGEHLQLTMVRVYRHRALSGGEDDRILLWDIDKGKALCSFQGHRGDVIGLEVDWRSHRVLSGSDDCTVRLWEFRETDKPDGTPSADAVCSTELGCHEETICGVAVDWDSEYAITWSLDCTLRVWNLKEKTCDHVLSGHRGIVVDVDVDWEKMRGMSWDDDQAMMLWDLDAGALLFEFSGHIDAISGVQVGWDQSRAISWSFDTILLWDLNCPTSACELRGHTSDVACVSVNETWERALSAGKDGKLCLWSLRAGGSMAPLHGHHGAVYGLEVQWDADRALSWGEDWSLYVWDLARCRALYRLRGHADVIGSAAVDWETRQILSWSDDRTLCLWDLPDNSGIGTAGVATPSGGASTACHKLEPARHFKGHTGPIWSAEVNWDSRRALSWSLVDSTVRLWDLDGGQAHELGGPSVAWGGSVEVSWSRQRALAWSCSGQVLWVWDLERGMLLHELRGHDGGVRCAALKH